MFMSCYWFGWSCYVNRTVESALSLTRGQIIERAQLQRGLDEVPPVLMDDGRLAQVVVNLLVNAAQAIPKAYGRDQSVTVSTRSDGRHVEIEVRDTGVGHPEGEPGADLAAVLHHQERRPRHGLGLSISREIVERAGGQHPGREPPAPPGGDDPADPPARAS